MVYDTYHGVAIKCAKFHTCTSSSFGGVKIDRHTDEIGLSTDYTILVIDYWISNKSYATNIYILLI